MKCWRCFKPIVKGEEKVKVKVYTLHKKCASEKVMRFLESVKL